MNVVVRPVQDMLARRSRLLGPSYRLFYDQPVHLVRGERVWLFDAEGRRYLDMYNNVPCVGHCHPRVVAALTEAASTLNTHTRYLHDGVLDLADALLATMPKELGHVMFCCSGSEANDLAIRVARAATGGRGVIVTANAYHGVTETIAGMSPSLGAGVPTGPGVYTVPAPSAATRGNDVAGTFADGVRAALARMKADGVKPAALLFDMVFSSDGLMVWFPSRWSIPSRSRSARHRRAGPLQRTFDIVPRSWMCAGPAGTRCTGRMIPFQFHQASGILGFLRPSTITTSVFGRPGRSPRAGMVKGV